MPAPRRLSTFASVLLAFTTCPGCGGGTGAPPQQPQLAALASNVFGTIDPATGSMTHRSGPGTHGPILNCLAHDLEEGATYTVDVITGQLLRIDPESGDFDVIGGTGFEGLFNLAFDALRRRLVCIVQEELGGSPELLLVAIDPATAAATQVAAIPDADFALGDFGALTYDPISDRLLGLNGTELWRIHPVTGEAELVGDIGGPICDALEFDPETNTLWYARTGDLLQIDPSTAASTLVGSLGQGFTLVGGLAYDPASNVLMGVDVGSGQRFLVNTFSGQATAVGRTGLRAVTGLEIDPQTGKHFVASSFTSELLAIDPESGEVTVLGDTGVQFIRAMAMDPAAGILYVAEDVQETLFEIDPTTAAATEVGPLDTESIEGLAFDPLSNTLFGLDSVLDALLAIDTGTGSIKTIGPTGFGTPTGLAFDPQSGSLYGADQFGPVYHIDPALGEAKEVSDTPFGLGALAVEPQSGHLLAGSDRLVRIDPSTGDWRSLGELGHDECFGLALDGSTATLYGSGSLGIFRIDPVDGESSSLGDPVQGIRGLAFDAAKGVLYGSDTQLDVLVRIDTDSGEIDAIGAMGFGEVEGLAFDPESGILYGSDTETDELIRIDTITGAGKAIGPLGFEFVEGLEFDVESNTLFGCDGLTRQFLAIDAGSGAATARGPTGYRVRGLAGRVP
jgi:DNA-binding beta-propeller fold protein YncE